MQSKLNRFQVVLIIESAVPHLVGKHQVPFVRNPRTVSPYVTSPCMTQEWQFPLFIATEQAIHLKRTQESSCDMPVIIFAPSFLCHSKKNEKTSLNDSQVVLKAA